MSEIVDPFSEEETIGAFAAPDLPLDDEVPPEPPSQVVGEEQMLAEVERVWGVSELSRASAEALIEAWGLRAFCSSQLHRLALQEEARSQVRDEKKGKRK